MPDSPTILERRATTRACNILIERLHSEAKTTEDVDRIIQEDWPRVRAEIKRIYPRAKLQIFGGKKRHIREEAINYIAEKEAGLIPVEPISKRRPAEKKTTQEKEQEDENLRFDTTTVEKSFVNLRILKSSGSHDITDLAINVVDVGALPTTKYHCGYAECDFQTNSREEANDHQERLGFDHFCEES